jgi:hypothetical protein
MARERKNSKTRGVARSRSDLIALRPAEREARRRSLEALRIMRRERRSLSRAAREAGTTPKTVRRYTDGALQSSSGGRFKARRADRLLRVMNVLSTEGHLTVVVRGSDAASLVAEHANAVQHYLTTGDTSALDRFADKRVAGVTLETDPDAIETFALAGELDFEDIYDEPDGG